MIGGFNNDLQIASLVLSLIGQTAFVWMYLRVNWYVNYVGRALAAKSGSLWLSLFTSFLATMTVQVTAEYIYPWISALITFSDWTLTLAIMLQWRALWKQQIENKGEVVT